MGGACLEEAWGVLGGGEAEWVLEQSGLSFLRSKSHVLGVKPF